MILEIMFLYFPDGNWPTCCIIKRIKFYVLTRLGGMRNITMPIFFQNWSIQSRDIAIFRFSKWPLPPSFIFKITKFFWQTVSRGSRLMSSSNLGKISQSIAKILRLFNFLNGRRHLGFSNLRNFIGRQCLEGPDSSSC